MWARSGADLAALPGEMLLVPLPARPRPDIPAPRRGGAAASGYQAGAAGARAERGGAEGPKGCGKRREGPGRPPAGRPGGGGEGPARPYFLKRRRRPPEARTGRAARQPASMQLRRQPLSAPRPGDTRPAAQRLAGPLLLLLALQGAAASGGPEDAGWLQDAEPSSRLLSQAARAALHFFNFRAASPSALQVLANVLDGRAWVSTRARAPVLGLCGREREAPGAETARDGSRAPQGPSGRRVRGKLTCSFWHSQGHKECSQGSSHAWKHVQGETEEQAPKARLDLSRVGCYDAVTECTTHQWLERQFWTGFFKIQASSHAEPWTFPCQMQAVLQGFKIILQFTRWPGQEPS